MQQEKQNPLKEDVSPESIGLEVGGRKPGTWKNLVLSSFKPGQVNPSFFSLLRQFRF